MADTWLDITGYESTIKDGRVLILKRGGKYVRSGIRPEEATLTVIAEASDGDEARRIVRALRATMERPDV